METILAAIFVVYTTIFIVATVEGLRGLIVERHRRKEGK